MKTMNNKRFPSLTINVKSIKDFAPKTDRYADRFKDKLYTPKTSLNNKSKISEEFRTIKTKAEKASYLKNIAKNYSTTVRNYFHRLIIKKQLNHKSKKEANSPKNKTSYLSTSKKKEKKQNNENENIIARKRFSVVIPQNDIKNFLNHNNSKDFLKYNKTRQFKSSKSLKNNMSESFKSKRLSLLFKEKYSKQKEKSPFEVEEEDKMFKGTIIKKKKKKKKKKFRIYNSKDTPLNKVYKKIPYIMSQLDKVKKQKKDMSLIKYQKTLLDLGNQIFDREINNKLNQKFLEIRKATEKRYDYFEKVIDSIEDREKTIIRQINTQQNFFKRIMINNNKSNLIYGVSNKIDFFPDIKFHRAHRHLLNINQ